MATITGQATDPESPGVLGLPMDIDLPVIPAIGVKGDGGKGYPGPQPGVVGRIGYGVYGTTEDPNGAGILADNTGGGYAASFQKKVQVFGDIDAEGNANVKQGVNVSGNVDVKQGVNIEGNQPAVNGFALFVVGNATVLGQLNLNQGSNAYAIDATGNARLSGVLTVGGDIVLAGADCAEEFDIGVQGVEPGTVMVLGENGLLCPSERGYDKRVAGVVSGAGDYRPGVVLDRHDSSQRRMPIALLGKVFCKADAQYGPIEIGDLLTTSPTPGHAMCALDQTKAFGAVLGKALRPLQSGQGLLPILIALQ